MSVRTDIALVVCLPLLVPVATAGAAPMAPTPLAGNILEYDQVIAQVPQEQARIAPVALAKLTIALHRAKKQAAQTLCEGNWLPEGDLAYYQGPTPVAQPETSGHWRYEAIRQPRVLGCEHTSRARFFLEMSRHLPAWVAIRPAGQRTLYRQGTEEPSATVDLVRR